MFGRTKPRTEILNLDRDIFWNKSSSNPTPDDVPPKENALWLNTDTGEIFVFTGLTNGKAVWKGQFGSIVAASKTSVFDIFGDDSCVALYEFEGNANDTGGIFNGAWYESRQPTNGRYGGGKFGLAAAFREDKCILINPDSNFGLSEGGYALSLWVSILSGGNSRKTIFALVNHDKSTTIDSVGCGGYGVLLTYNVNNGEITLNLGIDYRNQSNSPTEVFSSIGTIPLQEWKHIVISCDTISFKAFIDGVKVYEDNPINLSSLDSSSLNTLVLGGCLSGNTGGSSEKMAGYIDQFRLFKRPLSEEEIKQLYQEG